MVRFSLILATVLLSGSVAAQPAAEEARALKDTVLARWRRPILWSLSTQDLSPCQCRLPGLSSLLTVLAAHELWRRLAV